MFKLSCSRLFLILMSALLLILYSTWPSSNIEIFNKHNQDDSELPKTFSSPMKDELTTENFRQFAYTKEELILTKVITRLPYQCRNEEPISVYIKSRANAFERRQTLRRTWISETKSLNISVFFAIGLSTNKSEENLIENESQKYQDLIQFGFIDAYHNLTLKSIAVLRWSEKYCKTRHVLSVDDDVIVNIQLFLDNINSFKKGIYGVLCRRFKPVRQPNSKWYISNNYYKHRYYPEYLFGLGYLLSDYCVETLIEGIDSYSDYVIFIDDVFITGIIAEKVSIARYNSQLFHKSFSCSNPCVLSGLGVYYGCNSDEKIELHWKVWQKYKQGCRWSPASGVANDEAMILSPAPGD